LGYERHEVVSTPHKGDVVTSTVFNFQRASAEFPTRSHTRSAFGSIVREPSNANQIPACGQARDARSPEEVYYHTPALVSTFFSPSGLAQDLAPGIATSLPDPPRHNGQLSRLFSPTSYSRRAIVSRAFGKRVAPSITRATPLAGAHDAHRCPGVCTGEKARGGHTLRTGALPALRPARPCAVQRAAGQRGQPAGAAGRCQDRMSGRTPPGCLGSAAVVAFTAGAAPSAGPGRSCCWAKYDAGRGAARG